MKRLVQVNKKLRFFANYFVEKYKSFATKAKRKGEPNNTMNVTTILEEKKFLKNKIGKLEENNLILIISI